MAKTKLEAFQAFGCSLAVKHRLPEPTDPGTLLQPPFSHCWPDGFPLLDAFLHDPAADWKPVAECLAQV
jgi:hypothetical protein